jgi:membrane carboxypeptidase/penicillin-binding protein
MGYEKGERTLDGLLNLGGQHLGPISPPTVIWQSYMQKVLQDKPIKKFEDVNVPQSLVPASADSARTSGTAVPAADAYPPGSEVPPGSTMPNPFLNNPFPDYSLN